MAEIKSGLSSSQSHEFQWHGGLGSPEIGTTFANTV
jgi:hypothetical protein